MWSDWLVMTYVSLFMEDLILSLNPIFGTGFLGIADPMRFPMRKYERVGPEHYDDANCNKIIFAVLAMTLFRALLGGLLTFAFDVMHTLIAHRANRAALLRNIADHVLALFGGSVVVFGVFHLFLEMMENLRLSGRIFGVES